MDIKPKGLTVFSGFMGAGKSTAARNLRTKYPHAILLAYDSVRRMWPGLSAPAIMAKLIKTASFWLKLGLPVIIDACNLHPHDRIRWETVAIAHDVEMEWVAITTPVDECVRRDSQRFEPVGEAAIRHQYLEVDFWKREGDYASTV